jgi:hypothetical protein
MSWLGRIADYERPWVGRVGLALVIILWLFVSGAAVAVGVANGLAILIGGAALILGHVWSERNRELHPSLVIAWRLGVRIAIGAVVIVLGLVRSDGWAALAAAAFGAWLILAGVVVASALWLQTREAAVGGDE